MHCFALSFEQLLVVEARHKSGRVLEVIRSENFRMPRNDLEMLVQSHTEGECWESVEGVEGLRAVRRPA